MMISFVLTLFHNEYLRYVIKKKQFWDSHTVNYKVTDKYSLDTQTYDAMKQFTYKHLPESERPRIYYQKKGSMIDLWLMTLNRDGFKDYCSE